MTGKSAAALLLFIAYASVTWSEPRILNLAIGDSERRNRQVLVYLDTIVDTRRNDILSAQALLQRLDKSRLILIAEEHTNLSHHQVQLRVLELAQEAGRPLMIGLEMFPASDQRVLDDWTAGSLRESEFIEQADWYGGWGYDWDYYRDIFLFARANNVPMMALNASRDLVAEVRSEGLSAVRQRRNAELPPIVAPSSSDYRTLISSFFATDDSVHGALPEEQMNALLEAQSTWDAVMAYTASTTLAAYPERTLVVLAGTGHVAYELGIARQIGQWVEGPVTTIVPVAVGETATEVRASLGDFIWGVPSVTDPDFPSLGTVTTSSDGSLRIIHVEPESPADLGGLEAGDVLSSLHGRPVSDKRQLNQAVAALEWGDEIVAIIQRDGVERSLTVKLRR